MLRIWIPCQARNDKRHFELSWQSQKCIEKGLQFKVPVDANDRNFIKFLIRHPELVLGSHLDEIPKQVRNDKRHFEWFWQSQNCIEKCWPFKISVDTNFIKLLIRHLNLFQCLMLRIWIPCRARNDSIQSILLSNYVTLNRFQGLTWMRFRNRFGMALHFPFSL